MNYTLVGTEDGSNITVFIPGRSPLQAHSSHPNFNQIVEGVRAGDEDVADLFDLAETAQTRFERVTDRVSTANGRLYLDGDEVNNVLATQVVRSIGEGVQDFMPLVRFLENVAQNTNEHSREMLADWLAAEDFTITEDGLIVGYKGVRLTDSEIKFESILQGHAIVDGQEYRGNIPNYKGAVVEMPRSEVTHDPAQACSQGLHVGTYSYANGFAQGALLEVHVHPRDVVSVPNDHDAQKMRVCRYTVIDTIDAPHTVPVLFDDFEEEGDDYWNTDFWGDDEDDLYLDEDEGTFDLDDLDPVDDLDTEDEDPEDAPVNPLDVQPNDAFEDTDSRRQGRTFVVESVEDGYAVGKSLPQNVTRKVRVDRLLSRKYRRI